MVHSRLGEGVVVEAVSKSPAYLVRRKQTWYFRIAVPADLQARLGKWEYRRSLGTGYLRQARPMAMKLGATLGYLFAEFQKGKGMELTDAQLQEITEEWIKNVLDEWQQSQLKQKPKHDYQLEDPRYIDPDLISLEEWVDQAREALVANNLGYVSRTLDEVLAEKGLQIPKDSDTYRNLSLRMILASIESGEIAQKRYYGDYSDRFFNPTRIKPASVSSFSSDICPVKLSEIKDTWFSRNPQWPKETTQKNYANFIGTFIEIVEDIPIGELTKDQVREYGDVLASLPAKRKTKKKYRDLNLAQLKAMRIPDSDKMKPKTIKDSIVAVKAFLSWAEDNYNGVPSNLGGPLKAPQAQTDPSVSTAEFTNQDLQAIFHGPDYLEDNWKDKQAARFWVPLLLLFTGARNEEMAQLHLSDIQDRDGVWVFDINDDEDKKIKGLSAKRIIPIHPTLLDIGLMNYVDRLKSTDNKLLFPYLNRSKSGGKKSDTLGKWFNRTYKDKIGLEDGPEGKKVLYSFRHTFSSLGPGADRRLSTGPVKEGGNRGN